MSGDEMNSKPQDQEGVEVEHKPGSQEADAEHGQEASAGAEAEVEARIQAAVEEALAAQKDTVLRAQAELQNMRRRCEADVEKAHKYALEKFSGQLLSVMDNLERALQSVPADMEDNIKPLYEGVELTYKGFLDTFNKFDITQIDPVGEPFDPQMHEAMATQPSDQVEPNTVVAVMQKGYLLNGRVIRPAMVVVSKA